MFSTVEALEVILRHNLYDGNLPPPFSITYPYGNRAATFPQRHLELHFLTT
jgi:hypothetical protein